MAAPGPGHHHLLPGPLQSLLSGCHPSPQALTVPSPHIVRGILSEPRSDDADLLRTLRGSQLPQRKSPSPSYNVQGSALSAPHHCLPRCPGHTGFLIILTHARHNPASGPLHLLFPLPGMLFLHIAPLPNPSSLSSLSSNICSVRPPPALLPCLDLYLSVVLHPPSLVYFSS